jgi:DNA-binding Lrp family transcriptional regulator
LAQSQREATLFAPSGLRLDETDIAILRLLQADARISVQTIANEIGLSHSSALGRVNRLWGSGAIVRFVAEIDEAVLEAWPMLLVELVLTPVGRLAREDLDAEIRTAPEVLEAIEIVGECDLLLKVALPLPAHWGSLRRRIDPTAALIDTSRPRMLGRTVKRPSVHPLLVGR